MSVKSPCPSHTTQQEGNHHRSHVFCLLHSLSFTISTEKKQFSVKTGWQAVLGESLLSGPGPGSNEPDVMQWEDSLKTHHWKDTAHEAADSVLTPPLRSSTPLTTTPTTHLMPERATRTRGQGVLLGESCSYRASSYQSEEMCWRVWCAARASSLVP